MSKKKQEGYSMFLLSVLSSFFTITRCHGILVRSCDPGTYSTKTPARLTSGPLFFFLPFFVVFARNPAQPLPFHRRDERRLRSVPHANSLVKGSRKIVARWNASNRSDWSPRNAHKNVRAVVVSPPLMGSLDSGIQWVQRICTDGYLHAVARSRPKTAESWPDASFDFSEPAKAGDEESR